MVFYRQSFNTLAVPPEILPQDVCIAVVIRSDSRIVMGGYSQLYIIRIIYHSIML